MTVVKTVKVVTISGDESIMKLMIKVVVRIMTAMVMRFHNADDSDDKDNDDE